MKAVPIPNVCLNILKQSVNTKREQTSIDILHSFNGVSVLGLGIGYPRKSSLSSCALTQEAVITPVAHMLFGQKLKKPRPLHTGVPVEFHLPGSDQKNSTAHRAFDVCLSGLVFGNEVRHLRQELPGTDSGPVSVSCKMLQRPGRACGFLRR